MDHHIFLSYSRGDTAMMQRLRDDLRSNGFQVWTDENIEPGSPSWKMDIEKAIHGAGCLVIILSPDAVESKWVRAEIDFAELLQKPMYALLVRGEEINAVPFGLTTHQWIDMRAPHQYTSAYQMLIGAISNRFTLLVTGSARDSVVKSTPITGRRLPLRLAVAVVTLLILIGVAGLWSMNNLASMFAKATLPSESSSGEWVIQRASNISMAVPPDWILGMSGTPTSEALSVMYNVIDETASSLEAAAALKAAFPTEAYKLVFGNLVIYRIGAITEQDLPIAVSLDVIRLWARTLLEGIGVTIVEDSILTLPAGDVLRLRSHAQTRSGPGEAVSYFLVLERKLYTTYFLIGLTDTVNQDVDAIIGEVDAIMQTFKIES